ncbi:MAG: SDR family oxidoreductase [Chloroflexota bacterium]
MDKKPKVIVISGGSRGLGQAVVADLLAQGHIVATFSRSQTPFITECLSKDPDAQNFFWEAVDATDLEHIKQFATAVTHRYGQIDVLVNNAAIGVDGILTLMRDSDIERGLTVNLEAAIHLMQVCLKSMLTQQSGCVINVTSINGLRGYSGVSVYSATKAALDGMTRSLAREMGPQGIRVNSVAPGYFESEMTKDLTDKQRGRIARRTPLQRLGTAQEIANLVRFLISPEAGFITGQVIAVDGGFTC